MARFLSQHTLACLTRQGAEDLCSRLQRSASPAVRKVLLNLQEGKMIIEFDAASREKLEQFLGAERFHFDWILRIEYEAEAGRLRSI